MAHVNTPAPNAPFFTPIQDPIAGTYLPTDGTTTTPPKLFTPLRMRGLTLQNRITLSPMAQYSSPHGAQTPWHTAHLGGILTRGPGLTIIEANAVTPAGRTTPTDAGLWSDAQTAPLAATVALAHSQGQLIAVQLAHAGAKGSTAPPWFGRNVFVPATEGGWPADLLSPSGLPYADGAPAPRAATAADLRDVVAAFAAATRRAVHAGVDVVNVHAAHGYLLHEFLSPATNRRTDEYGGDLANRARLLLEVVAACRAEMPAEMPLQVRISATDWLEGEPAPVGPGWTLDESVKLATLLEDAGVDVLDVSSGGVHPAQKLPPPGPAYQASLAQRIKAGLPKGSGLLVMTVGAINSGELAERLLQGDEGAGVPGLDLVAVGKGFLKNPGLVFAWAEELRVKVAMPIQIGWGFGAKR